MTDISKRTIAAADKALRSKTSGEKWTTITAIPALCATAMAIKVSDLERKEAIAPHKKKMDEAAAPFKQILTDLKKRDVALRARLLTEYPSTEGITIPGVGNLAFTEQWVYEIADPNKVDPVYCDAVNDDKIAAAIGNGVRSIKGVKIYPARTVRITPTKEA
jgi:hypothetical protein